MDIEQRIRELEEELRNTPYNKATQHHIGLLKAKIAKLKEKLEKSESKRSGGRSFAVKKQGDATVILLGPPSVGKSTLLNALTNAESEVGAYEFTTLTVIPGMLVHRGARIQLVDIPGIIGGAHSGKGRGREILSFVRSADLLLIMGENTEQIREVLGEVQRAGVRVNKVPPDVVIKKTQRGGINVSFAIKPTKIDESLVKEIMREYGYHNADVVIRQDVNVDEFIDALRAESIKYVPGVFVITKVDKKLDSEIEQIKKEFPEAIFISAETGKGLDELKDRIVDALQLVRVYTKKVGEDPNYDEPLILKSDSTVADACRKIHKDFLRKFQFARVWGPSVKFPGQRVGLDHVLKDGDVLELHIER